MGPTAIWGSLPPAARWTALALLVTQVLLVVVHLVAYELAASAPDPRSARHPFDFNQERTLPTWWSAAVMTCTGVSVVVLALGRKLGWTSLAAWLLVGCGFVWIGLEEGLLHAHEDAQVASGIDWPLIYLPALLVGGWAIIRVARDLARPFGVLSLVALAAMAAAVGVELLSSPQIALDFQLRNLVEENLELAGASLLLVAALGGVSGSEVARSGDLGNPPLDAPALLRRGTEVPS